MKWINTPKLVESISALIIIGLVAYGLVITVEQARSFYLPLGWNQAIKGQLSLGNPAQVSFTPVSTPSSVKTDAWIEKLGDMESCSSLGTLDSGSLSYGRFCWKRETWEHYAKLSKLFPYAEDYELMNLLDKSNEKKVVKWIVKNEPGQLTHLWYTTIVIKGLGLPE